MSLRSVKQVRAFPFVRRSSALGVRWTDSPAGRPGGTGRRQARGADGPQNRTDRVDVIGLPDSVQACLFDLDGVLTRTTVHASEAAVFEDALAGVAAGRVGGFACVVGVDQVGQGGALRECGASIVGSDLSELPEDR